MQFRSHIPARPSLNNGFPVDAVLCYPATTPWEYFFLYGSSLLIDWRKEEESLPNRLGHKILDTMSDNDIKDIIYRKRDAKEFDKCLKDMEYYLSIRLGKEQKYDKEKDKQLLEEKKATVGIMDVIGGYVSSLRYKRGSLIKCPLPDHKDGTASFKIYDKENRFKCFGCQKGGSQIDFIMEMEKCSLKDAITKFVKF